MPARPSDPLLELLRKVSKEMKLNTAALAEAIQVPRGRMKHILAGSEPMTVDEFILLSQVLKLDPTGMAQAESEGTPSAEEGGAAEGAAESAPTLRPLPRNMGPELNIDPLGNHSWQILQLGLMLGVDMFIVLDVAQIQESGVPKAVLARYPQHLPLRLDAAYHRHHALTYLPEGLQVRLSFDALYTCVLPWAAFVEIRMTPLAPEPVAPEPDPEPEPDPDENRPRRGHLRLV